jgi:hypothetical protein
MTRRKIAAVAMVVAFFLVPGVSHAVPNKKALVGLKGVYVIVENMDPQAENLGLRADQIETDVELRLRKAGVRVLTKEEIFKTTGMPSLCVNVLALVARGLVTYSVEVELSEIVTLDRGFRTHGVIWSDGGTGNVDIRSIGKIRESVGDKVDKFINDYLAANPKK